MKVILLQDVKGTGKKEQVVEVSDGYGRNYLLPRKLAAEATATAINAAQRAKSADEHREALKRKEAQDLADQLRKKSIHLKVRCGEKGRLYGSITGQEVADALKVQYGVTVDKRRVELSQAIHSVGTYEASVWLYAGISAQMTVEIEPS